MAAYFCDSSALVKRYVSETGTAWITALLAPAPGKAVIVARLTAVEVVSAIVRRGRGGTVPAPAVTASLAQLRTDFAVEYQVVEITPGLITQATALVETDALRGYDAVQLAVAPEVADQCRTLGIPLKLLSADTELNTAATAEGLAVDDPNSHP